MKTTKANKTAGDAKSNKASRIKNGDATGVVAARGRNKMLIIVSILLACVLLFCAVMAVVAIVRNMSVVMSCDGAYMDVGEATYLAATFKSMFINRYGLSDTAQFWASRYSAGQTWGELLQQKTEEYLRQLTFGARLYDSIATMSKENEKMIEEQLLAMLEGQRSSAAFIDSQADICGYNFDDMVDAGIILYKSYLAKRLLFGDQGATLEKLAYSEQAYYREEVESFFASEYRYVSIAYIRLESEIDFDDDGNYSPGNDGTIEMRPLTDEEKAERAALVAEVKDKISSGSFTSEELTSIIKQYNKNYDYSTTGYYFATTSSATVDYNEKISADVIAKVFEMDEGDFAVVDEPDMAYIVYRGAHTSEYAFEDLKYSDFFGDFYSDAADHIFASLLEEGMTEVKVKDKYYEIDVLSLKPNTSYRLSWLFG